VNKQIQFANKEQVKSYREKIVITTNEKMKDIVQMSEGIDFLKQIKFEQCGFDPLFEEPTNFIEQVNQTFTYLVCLSAVDILLSRHCSHKFNVNFGTQAGFDIVSEDESIICECFAATTPDSNRKLEKDVKKVYENKFASIKYVIYYASIPKAVHLENIRKKYQGIEIVVLGNI
jgi:hypothetical protein